MREQEADYGEMVRSDKEVDQIIARIKEKALKTKMQNDKILHLREGLALESELRLSETPKEGSDLLPTSANFSDKGNILPAEKQRKEEEFSKDNGEVAEDIAMRRQTGYDKMMEVDPTSEQEHIYE